MNPSEVVHRYKILQRSNAPETVQAAETAKLLRNLKGPTGTVNHAHETRVKAAHEIMSDLSDKHWVCITFFLSLILSRIHEDM